MELICPQCGRDQLRYDPCTGNFDCMYCGEVFLPEDLPCPFCGRTGPVRVEDETLVCSHCGEALCDLYTEDPALDYYYDEILCNCGDEDAGEVWDSTDP